MSAQQGQAEGMLQQQGGRDATPAAATTPGQSGRTQHHRRPAATMHELRSKAAFRACDRLMEHGAASEAQLWSVARVMCGEEYEQAAEERAIAGKCGNPLCSRDLCSRLGSGGGRYRISAAQQTVFERGHVEYQPTYCSAQCEAAAKHFAVQLGSGALALERFSAMYQMLQQQEQQGQEQRVQQQQQERERPVQAAGPAPVLATTAPPGPAAAADAPVSCRDSDPGGIKSSDSLVPRLAVEQAEVKHIDSSAGQFGDFSRKPKPRAAPADGTPPPPKPKGVLKKQSQFAAGSARVPIMFADVKERDLSVVAAETARSLQPGHATGRKAAAAVEGYVPRAMSSRRQRQRRVRFTDDVLEVADPAGKEQAAVEKKAITSLAAPAAMLGGKRPPPAASGAADSSTGLAAGRAGSRAPTSAGSMPGPNGASAFIPASSSDASSGSGLVFEVEDSKGPSGGGVVSKGLAAQFGRLYVAGAPQQSSSAALSLAPAPNRATVLSPLLPSSRGAASSSIDIQQHGSSGSSSSSSGLVVPRAWREVPQFYAHSPVGSSSSLAGSCASPGSSSSNLATMTVASSPPQVHMLRRRYSSPPPGLPRAPTTRLGSQPGLDLQPQQQAPGRVCVPGGVGSSTMDGLQGGQTQQQEHGEPAAEQPALTKRQVEQLQHAFPPLSAALPPELRAALASDSEAESEAGDSEDWMQSDDEDEGPSASFGSDDEALPPGSRSSFQVRLSFFGTLFMHLEAWLTPVTVELVGSGPDAKVVLPPPTSPEVLAALSCCLAAALPPVLAGLQAAAPRGLVERSLDELLHSLRLVGPLPALKFSQWQMMAVLFLKALSLERCPPLREAFETRDGIGRLNRLLASLSFTSEEYWALLELLCPTE